MCASVDLRWYKYNHHIYIYTTILQGHLVNRHSQVYNTRNNNNNNNTKDRVFVSLFVRYTDWSDDDTSSDCLSCTTSAAGQCVQVSVINYLPFSYYTSRSYNYTQKNTAAIKRHAIMLAVYTRCIDTWCINSIAHNIIFQRNPVRFLFNKIYKKERLLEPSVLLRSVMLLIWVLTPHYTIFLYIF
jgi:hypothetical protein